MRAGDGTSGDLDLQDDGQVPMVQDRREEKVRGEFWDKFRRVASRIPFADDLVAAYYCAMDPKTPTRVRGTLLGALAYFILPVDAIPDLIPGLGFTDDAAVLAAVIAMLGEHITETHRLAAAKALGKASSDDTADA